MPTYGILSVFCRMCIPTQSELIYFFGGFERDGAKTSGFFKLQKIRTLKRKQRAVFRHQCLPSLHWTG
ncbi:MAG: hypothetical protein UW27_C0001G0015 [Parcubacteria group bacterium GW2011_GWA1_44_13]|uniref:Uncharacterized protein n=1 Tax=Candidatus Nomurabacteria bacterium GW2011_GWB1_44_12 TaxID=1618748 RepID=A0A837IBY1_9BACT|nr:MAG: hypothetical protein UW25_C0001G0015 [Candidatus Nomurabacteria bacterium GW2011_GWB1_44_12]KKT38519.1 MAG: hypothetical protein UW27_C0001G0015 [Parcubacteria group bacterium GW2011_GWA1_44_13]